MNNGLNQEGGPDSELSFRHSGGYDLPSSRTYKGYDWLCLRCKIDHRNVPGRYQRSGQSKKASCHLGFWFLDPERTAVSRGAQGEIHSRGEDELKPWQGFKAAFKALSAPSHRDTWRLTNWAVNLSGQEPLKFQDSVSVPRFCLRNLCLTWLSIQAHCNRLLLLAPRSAPYCSSSCYPGRIGTHRRWLFLIFQHNCAPGALHLWHQPFQSHSPASLHAHSAFPTSVPLHLLFLSARKLLVLLYPNWIVASLEKPVLTISCP